MLSSIDEKTRSTTNIFSARRIPDNCLLIIYGGSGDLAKRKLFPALANLLSKGQMPARFKIIAVGRKKVDIQTLLSMGEFSEHFSHHFRYVQSDYSPEGIAHLKTVCEEICRESHISPNYLHYLAIPPNGYADVAKAIKDGDMVYPSHSKHWSRLVVEKPYGRDLQSATELNTNLLATFSEKQIYRIDHYLGKEVVQNLLVFRFANSVFEPIWNHHFIEHIQISSSEYLGVGDRAEYFDQAGVLRDMVQNHLMQIFSLISMEPPVNLSADAIRDEKVKVLRSLRPVDLETQPPMAIRGQYGPGEIKGKEAIGYREEKNVPVESSIDTFVALRLHLDNLRWAGVPFYLRSGKALSRKGTEVVVTFKSLPNVLFNTHGQHTQQNQIVFKIQPQEGILLELTSKTPGQSFELVDTSMKFSYGDRFDTRADAYERLLLDAILGDPTLFVRSDETELSWSYLDPLIKHWDANPAGPLFPNYRAGSEGPAEATDILLPTTPPTHWLDFSKWDNL